MDNQDEWVKTALRLTRALHDEIKASAEISGHSMNAEILARLHARKDIAAATTILARIDEFETSMRERQRRGEENLWRVIDRAESLVSEIDVALEAGATGESIDGMRREIRFLLELIEFAKAGRT
ncbi:Arc family DNA-binding protein [Paraburkholderia strydomiana]|uniref:Arc family DNA-binding protein n=1 Tax=Paraburkholderia strydomiana TaxID=1245417 RepID=UPI0038BD6DC5